MSKQNNKVLICTERGCKAPQQEDGSECQLHYDAKNLLMDINVYYGNINFRISKENPNKVGVAKFKEDYLINFLNNKMKAGKFKVVENKKGGAYPVIELK